MKTEGILKISNLVSKLYIRFKLTINILMSEWWIKKQIKKISICQILFNYISIML